METRNKVPEAKLCARQERSHVSPKPPTPFMSEILQSYPGTERLEAFLCMTPFEYLIMAGRKGDKCVNVARGRKLGGLGPQLAWVWGHKHSG